MGEKVLFVTDTLCEECVLQIATIGEVDWNGKTHYWCYKCFDARVGSSYFPVAPKTVGVGPPRKRPTRG